jgi:hypothetical protein
VKRSKAGADSTREGGSEAGHELEEKRELARRNSACPHKAWLGFHVFLLSLSLNIRRFRDFKINYFLGSVYKAHT